jgi:hypothetical protein
LAAAVDERNERAAVPAPTAKLRVRRNQYAFASAHVCGEVPLIAAVRSTPAADENWAGDQQYYYKCADGKCWPEGRHAHSNRQYQWNLLRALPAPQYGCLRIISGHPGTRKIAPARIKIYRRRLLIARRLVERHLLLTSLARRSLARELRGQLLQRSRAVEAASTMA